jgi:uncharacterized protein (TIGR02452 family)
MYKRRLEVVRENFKLYESYSPKNNAIVMHNTELLEVKEGGAVPIISVVCADTVNYAMSLANSNSPYLVLNMANPEEPGAGKYGWMSGSGTQEDQLLYRTMLYTHLPQEEYPFKSETTCIITPKVPIIRDDSYNMISSPLSIDIITASAYINVPKNSEKVEREMRKHIHGLLKAIVTAGYKNALLSAWGCGAFRCDSDIVARLFKELIPLYPLERVVFAILGDAYEVFKSLLEN